MIRRRFVHELPCCKSFLALKLQRHSFTVLESYKQNKFNLLREQSEGYSKLTAELTSSLGPSHSPATGYPIESKEAVHARAKPAWERVVGLIGYFDLDPNRALDVILDVFSMHLSTHYSFFLSFLGHSPWSSSIHRQLTAQDAMSVESSPNQYQGKDLDDILYMAESQSGYPASRPQIQTSAGGRVLAQVLGFKFSHYQVRTIILCLEIYIHYLCRLPEPQSLLLGTSTSPQRC